MDDFLDRVRTKQHVFCTNDCPLFRAAIETERFYARGEVIESNDVLTCEHYDFCGRFVMAMNNNQIKL